MSSKHFYQLCPSCGNSLWTDVEFCCFCGVENRQAAYAQQWHTLLEFLDKLGVKPGTTEKRLSDNYGGEGRTDEQITTEE